MFTTFIMVHCDEGIPLRQYMDTYVQARYFQFQVLYPLFRSERCHHWKLDLSGCSNNAFESYHFSTA